MPLSGSGTGVKTGTERPISYQILAVRFFGFPVGSSVLFCHDSVLVARGVGIGPETA